MAVFFRNDAWWIDTYQQFPVKNLLAFGSLR